MTPRALPLLLSRRLPFFYGWVVLGCVCCAGFSRQGGAVATLSIFVEPMTRDFGWSRVAISGAVSLGGLLAAVFAPLLGRVLDRQGARAVLCWAILLTGAADMTLSLTTSLLMFYALFCVARMNFAGPFDLGIYGAVNNWFVARRSVTTAIATLAQMVGLVSLPLIAEAGMLHGGWRAGWLAVGLAVLVGRLRAHLAAAGPAPPRIIGLGAGPPRQAPAATTVIAPQPRAELYPRRCAVGPPASGCWSLFTVFAYPVQAGVRSAPGAVSSSSAACSRKVAATVVSTFSRSCPAVASFCFRIFPSLSGRCDPRGARLRCCSLPARWIMLGVQPRRTPTSPPRRSGPGSAGCWTLLPITWADYTACRSFGATAGFALSGPGAGAGCPPILSGVLRDRTGSYDLSLECFAVLSGLAVLAALVARPP